MALNSGNVILTDVSISDPLLGTLSCTPDQPATLAPTEKRTCTATYALTQADIDARHVPNPAVVTSRPSSGGDGPSGQDSTDEPVPQNKTVSLTKIDDLIPAKYDHFG